MTGSSEPALTFAGLSTRRLRQSSCTFVMFEKSGKTAAGTFACGHAGPVSMASKLLPLDHCLGVAFVNRFEPLTLSMNGIPRKDSDPLAATPT